MKISYACDLMCMCVEFRNEILLRGKNVKPEKKSIFLKNGKTVILVGNLIIFLISDDEMDCTIEIVSRNLVTQSTFVEFQDSQNFTFFEAPSVGDTCSSATWHDHVDATWHLRK